MIQLRRITSTGRFVPEIDGLRFVAIAAVVLYHFHGFLRATGSIKEGSDLVRTIADNGDRGVNLFYVLSGFILGVPFAEHRLKGRTPVSRRAYFLRRLTRLEPPYILNLLLCFALLLATGGSAQALLPHLAASALYMHNFWFGEHSLINPVAWSLEVEVQFYFLAPVLAMVFAIRSKVIRRTVLLVSTLAAGIIQTYYLDVPGRFLWSILFAIQFFLAGFLMADIYVADWDEKSKKQWAWDLVAIFSLVLLFTLGDRAVWVVLPFLAITLCVATFRGVWTNRILTNGVVTTLGGMCYTIYLTHYVLIPPILRLTSNLHWAVKTLIYLTVLLVISIVYFVLIERPCMKRDWPQRALAWVRGSRPVSASGV